MNLQIFGKLQLKHLLLLAILGMAYYIAFIPHLNYLYPLHVDEWVHMARAEALMKTGNVVFPDPFLGGVMGLGENLEASFQLFWGTFQTISGIPWTDVFRFFPGVIFIITVLAVYILADRENYGVEAAFFTLLIPTTIGVLGPAFLVPVSLGLLFTPLILFLAFNFRTIWSYTLIFAFICFLLAIHAPSAIYPIILLIPYILLNLKGDFKHSIWLGLTLILPYLIIFPWIFSLLLPTAKSLFVKQTLTEYIQLPRVIQTYGYLPILFALLGTFTLAIRGGKKSYGLALGLLAQLLMLVAYYSFHYGVPIVYERGLVYMMLVLSVIAGAGLAAIKSLKLPEKIMEFFKLSSISKYIGAAACIALAAVIMATTIPHRLATQYYYMIDKEDYQAFIWIKDNIGDSYERAVLDPWKATAFSAITGKVVFTRIHVAPTPKDGDAYAFIMSGSSNNDFLKEKKVSIIYTRIYDGNQKQNFDFPASNPDLVEVYKNVYLVK